MLTIGTLVSFTQYTGMERKTGVVLKHFPDENQTLIIEIKTRKRHTVSDGSKDQRLKTLNVTINSLNYRFYAFNNFFGKYT